jgi:signal transduction histidine kinase/DNA-binding CsgD family transcriptional regulator
MTKPDSLLTLLTHLQGDRRGARGRRALLEYACQSSGARLALIYILNTSDQTLDLLEQSGQPPQAGEQELDENISLSDLFHLPVHGLFGHALQARSIQTLLDLHTDPRSLPGERHWAWPGGQVLLSAIESASGPQGLLVLCFSPDDNFNLDGQARSNLLLCTTLLSVYLTETDTPISSADSRQTETATLADQVQAAIDRERERIARDIHDGAAQQIVAVLHRLEFVSRLLEGEISAGQPIPASRELVLRELDRACEALEVGLNELRSSISSLLPPQLEDQDFDAALRTLLDEFAFHESGIEVSYENEHPDLVPLSLAAPLFRFVQEALHNVRKHAHASRVSVRVHPLPGLLVVEVQDNGIGFDPQQTASKAILAGAGASAGANTSAAGREIRSQQHFGLRDMQERIAQAGGRWHVISRPGAGTTVKAILPRSEPPFVLTRREHEVLRLLVEGLTNRAIAEKLSVSIETVKSHVHHIMQKLQVNDRTQAAVVATRLRLL